MQIKQLQFSRFIAAFAILVFHFAREAHSLAWGAKLWAISNCAVSFFFFLSGFVLTFVYINRGVDHKKRFYFARFARIYPLYILALLFTVLPISLKEKVDFTNLVLSLFMLQAWVPKHSQVLNTPAWAISVQLLFYLLFPFILSFVKQLESTKRILAIFISVWFTSLCIFILLFNLSETLERNIYFKDFVFYHPLMHLPTFILGSLSAILYIKEKGFFSRFNWLLILSPIVLFLLLVYIPNPMIRYHHNGLFCPLFFMILAGLSSDNNNPAIKLLYRPSFVLLGNISYAIYIMQKPVYLFWYWGITHLSLELTDDLFFWSFFIFLLLVSWIAYHFIERPLRTKLTNIVFINRATVRS